MLLGNFSHQVNKHDKKEDYSRVAQRARHRDLVHLQLLIPVELSGMLLWRKQMAQKGIINKQLS